MAQQVTKDMIIEDILQIDPNLAVILMQTGMHCVGCFASQGETLAEACFVHGLDENKIADLLNEYLAAKEEEGA
ncbi:MAG: DUF1858 domain-containing protein [Firmicutes bacterium]|jgi:hybrid cluster-associated redox disulfide protein|nr:DUF1858 domain-containing protein [Bacillota bacterium]